MDSKFENVTMDSDTRLLSQETLKTGEWDALFQACKWDGIYGESLIYVLSEVEHMGDEELKKLALESGRVKKVSEFTIGRNDETGYVFINFNFS